MYFYLKLLGFKCKRLSKVGDPTSKHHFYLNKSVLTLNINQRSVNQSYTDLWDTVLDLFLTRNLVAKRPWNDAIRNQFLAGVINNSFILRKLYYK